MVDAYCMAVGLRQQFTPENKRPFGISWYVDDPKSVWEERTEGAEEKAT